MEARLEARRSPAIAAFFALAVALLLLGAMIGYLVKPISTVAGPARLNAENPTQAAASPDKCDFVGGHKGC
jgi:hypothetical protein